MAKRHAHSRWQAQWLQDVPRVVIGFADMGADALRIQLFHHVARIDAFHIHADKPFAGWVVDAANDGDAWHLCQPGQVAGAMQHGLCQAGFMGMDCSPRRFDPAPRRLRI